MNPSELFMFCLRDGDLTMQLLQYWLATVYVDQVGLCLPASDPKVLGLKQCATRPDSVRVLTGTRSYVELQWELFGLYNRPDTLEYALLKV